MRLRLGFAVSALAATLTFPVLGQVSPVSQGPQTTVALHPDLLPTSFGDWKASPGGSPGSIVTPPFALSNASKQVLEECGPERSAVQTYVGPGGKVLHLEAAEFKDASGALAAFSALAEPGMREIKDLGTAAASGDGGVLVLSGDSVVAAYPASLTDSPARLVDFPSLKALEAVLPKPAGAKALQPLLPALLPARGLMPGSLRYAVGQRSYMAEGGVLPAAGLGWDKEAEAVTARYSDKRGTETLTLLLYPTPTIAGAHERNVEAQLPGLGPSFAHAKARREGPLVVVANGSFSPDAAQALVENTHMHQVASTDKAMVTPEVVQTRQTFGLLANVILFSGFLGISALIVAVFLGGGRAMIRVLRGKPPATEMEFLSLHLDPQNPTPVFSKD